MKYNYCKQWRELALRAAFDQRGPGGPRELRCWNDVMGTVLLERCYWNGVIGTSLWERCYWNFVVLTDKLYP